MRGLHPLAYFGNLCVREGGVGQQQGGGDTTTRGGSRHRLVGRDAVCFGKGGKRASRGRGNNRYVEPRTMTQQACPRAYSVVPRTDGVCVCVLVCFCNRLGRILLFFPIYFSLYLLERSSVVSNEKNQKFQSFYIFWPPRETPPPPHTHTHPTHALMGR